MLLSRFDFAALSPDRGSFRGFLKTSLRRFVISEERKKDVRARAERAVALPFTEAETLRPADASSPDEAFDRAWMRTVIDQMLARLRAELTGAGKDAYFEIFQEYCLQPGEPPTYEELARKHGLALHDVRNYLSAVRQRGRAIVHEIVTEYLAPGEDIDGELAFVLSR